MVIVIHQATNTKAALNYNEEKVGQELATLFMSQTYDGINASIFSSDYRQRVLERIEERNHRAKNKCLHISVNPTPEDMERLGEAGLRVEIQNFMDHLGYTHQPFFVYKHKDIDRTHLHIVSTRIDAQNFKKVKDSNEKRKTQQFITKLEEKYDLQKQVSKRKTVNLILTGTGKELKDSIQSVFRLMNASNLKNKQQYLDILKAFNLQLDEGRKIDYIKVNDKTGQTLRHPIPITDFIEPPNLQVLHRPSTSVEERQKMLLKEKLKTFLQAVNKQYRFYDLNTINNVMYKNGFVLFQSSKNGHYNVYAPKEKMVLNVEYELKRYFVRLKDFKLTQNDYGKVIKEIVSQLKAQYTNIAEGLIDTRQSIISPNKDEPKVVLKPLDYDSSEEFRKLKSSYNSKQLRIIKKEMQNYLQWLTERIAAHEFEKRPEENLKKSNVLENFSNHFMRELLMYRNSERKVGKKRYRRLDNQKRKGRKI
ncbi:relaxase/mobilization nuclease domain-containing protein [Carboxylicivirga sp. M1479]|uniref:relaxase/mobilization nuclease domain-containing protein n=1 Tax=Carboxylicivirga sp. M1479 TaxID=2594476 RepID=UPI001177E314|nr:relaxase/mobilization nuclease domain-containing protein [Carboxylicivirga sp. M1479]TRX66398.1 hypothetical protein FNN09_13610 [Carboxylicivirga sp. M1479]